MDRSSEHDATHKALFAEKTPALLAEARRRQDEIVSERFAGRPLRIADLGCGDAYHASLLAPYELYHGFELAPQMARMARARMREEGLGRAELFEGDLLEVDVQNGFYDLVLCLYFTPGNFRDVSDDLTIYDDDYLDHNPVFTSIVRRFHRAMKSGGHMLLCVYRDCAAAEAVQRELYESSGQHVETPRGQRFVATREGFWSVRWTRASMLSNLADAGIGADAVTFNELNEIAWLVEIVK